MVWRKVQVERPRASTSGGQSEGRVVVSSCCRSCCCCGVFREAVEGDLVEFFIIWSQAAEEVQERHLSICQPRRQRLI